MQSSFDVLIAQWKSSFSTMILPFTNNVFPIQNGFPMCKMYLIACIKMKREHCSFIHYLYVGFGVNLCLLWNPRYFGIWQMPFQANEITINHLFSENLFRKKLFHPVWWVNFCPQFLMHLWMGCKVYRICRCTLKPILSARFNGLSKF